ncbi:MAG: RNA methyltransferase [Lachnospiraceae bacterium]|nr:RNA methyltransferase [Lachnospiraceae bacterium]
MLRIIAIDRTDADALDVFTRMSETELRRLYEPERGLFIAESAHIVHRALDAGAGRTDGDNPDNRPVPVCLLCERLETEEEGRYRHAFADRNEPRVAGCAIDGYLFHPKIATVIRRIGEEAGDDVPVYCAPLSVLEKLTGYHLTGGVLCAMRRPVLPQAPSLLAGARRIVVTDHVTNPTNVGAIFRSAAALGADAVLLTESCSDPLYRRALRTGMGSAFQIPWTYVDDDYIALLHRFGFTVCAMALADRAVPVSDPRLSSREKLAVVLGNEGYGLPEDTVRASDIVCMIPMSHGVDSLNVAAASAVAFYALF